MNQSVLLIVFYFYYLACVLQFKNPIFQLTKPILMQQVQVNPPKDIHKPLLTYTLNGKNENRNAITSLKKQIGIIRESMSKIIKMKSQQNLSLLQRRNIETSPQHEPNSIKNFVLNNKIEKINEQAILQQMRIKISSLQQQNSNLKAKIDTLQKRIVQQNSNFAKYQQYMQIQKRNMSIHIFQLTQQLNKIYQKSRSRKQAASQPPAQKPSQTSSSSPQKQPQLNPQISKESGSPRKKLVIMIDKIHYEYMVKQMQTLKANLVAYQEKLNSVSKVNLQNVRLNEKLNQKLMKNQMVRLASKYTINQQ